MIGSSVAHFKVTSKLGEGGMGEVWRAEDTKLGREVALKMLPSGFADDPDRLARFEREARVLASLSHANIAGIHGIEESDGQRFLVMEIAEGEPLNERIARGPFSVEEAARVAVQIAQALESAHESGVVHRDLKPANVVLSPEGKVKVLDFGLAKALAPEGVSGVGGELSMSPTLTQAMTQAGVLLGTAGYMSPEQARGKPVDRRADIWAFGCVLYEMLTGRRTFDGETATDVLGAIVHKEPELDKLPADVPQRIRRLLEQCLQKDATMRLQSIGDARIALQEWLENPEAVVREEPSSSPGWMPWVAAAIAGVLGIALGAFFFRGAEPEPPPVRRFTVELAEHRLMTGRGAAAVISPDGKRLAIQANAGNRGVLYLRALDQLEPVQVAEGPSGSWPHDPFFSPDSQWMAFFTDTELKKMPVTGGSPITLADVGRPRGGDWSRDGRIVFSPGSDTGLSVVAASGGEVTQITEVPDNGTEAHRYPQWLPGDKAVLFTSVTPGGAPNVEVVELSSGERRVVNQGGSYGRYVPTGHVLFVDGAAVFAQPFDVDRLEATGSPMPVLEGVESQPLDGQAQYSVAADGTLLYVPGSDDVATFSIAWADRRGDLEPLWDEEGLYGTPRLSPDGRKLAVAVERQGNFDIWVYDLAREVPTRITFGEGYDADPVWSPDGRFIAFASDRDGPVAAYRTRSDGTGEAELLLESGEIEFPAPIDWSADGERLVLVTPSKIGSGNDLFFLAADGSGEIEPFLDSSFDESDAAFSRDGRFIAYLSTKSGRPEIYVDALDGDGHWQISDGGGWQPQWSGNSRELFFRTMEGLEVVTLSYAGGDLEVGRPELLFGEVFGGPSGVRVPGYLFYDYDVTAEGDRVVVFPRGQTGDEPDDRTALLVTGWLGELERLTAQSGGQ